MARKFQRKPDLFFCYLPTVGRVERNQILEGDHFAKFLGSHLVEIPEVPVIEPVVELTLEEMAKEHLADILPKEKLEEISFQVIAPEKEVAIEIPKDLVATEKEPGLEIKSKKGGRPKKIVLLDEA